MNPNLGMIGLARKGGLLAMGEEPTGTACRTLKAAAVFTASDAAENSVRRAKGFSDLGGVPHFKLNVTKDELGAACGRSSLAMFAICDTGLALSLAQRMVPEDEGLAALKEAAEHEKQLRKARGKKKK